MSVFIFFGQRFLHFFDVHNNHLLKVSCNHLDVCATRFGLGYTVKREKQCTFTWVHFFLLSVVARSLVFLSKKPEKDDTPERCLTNGLIFKNSSTLRHLPLICDFGQIPKFFFGVLGLFLLYCSLGESSTNNSRRPRPYYYSTFGT